MAKAQGLRRGPSTKDRLYEMHMGLYDWGLAKAQGLSESPNTHDTTCTKIHMGLYDWGTAKPQGLRGRTAHKTQIVLNTHGAP